MFWSKSKFFKRDRRALLEDRVFLVSALEKMRLDETLFLEAYDYFIDHPESYDGATIVKDLKDFIGLDLSATRHDYDYLIELKKRKGLNWLIFKLKVDFRYGKNMENLGKGIITPYTRTLALWLTTPIYLVILIITKK